MIYCVFDVETTTKKNISNDLFPAPWDRFNKLVCWCYFTNDKTKVSMEDTEELVQAIINSDLVVGHNIVFDLSWLWHDKRIRDWCTTRGQIFDTQFAEYLIRYKDDNRPSFYSLDDLSIKYGGTVKKDIIKEYWNNGIDTDKIPKYALMSYNKKDVLNTELIFLKQLPLLKDLGMLPEMKLNMETMVATIEMKYNGFTVDKHRLAKYSDHLKTVLIELEVKLKTQLTKLKFPSLLEHIKFTSTTQRAAILYGGYFKVPGIEITGKTKAGKIKTRKVINEIRYAGLGFVPPEDSVSKAGNASTDKSVIDALIDSCEDESKLEFLYGLKEYLYLSKIAGTYCTGLLRSIYNDDKIHPNYNFSSTVTNRLSCSNPNLQNIPRG